MNNMKKTILLIMPVLLLCGCKVKEKEKEITVFSDTVTSIYTGKVKRKMPGGEGSALMDNDSKVEGLFEKGIFISGQAESVPYSVTYGDRVFSGIYTGEVADRLPAGNGTFTSDAFLFDGIWNNGMPDGKGTVSAEHFRIDTSSGILEGSYSGDINKGKAEGNGTFIYQDGRNEIQMAGNFTGSQFDGLMVKTVRYRDTDKSYLVNYRNGKPQESAASMISYLEGMRKESYCLSEAQYKFISDHSSLFAGTGNDKDMAVKYNDSFHPETFRESDKPALIKINNAVIRSVERYKTYAGPETVTSMIVQNSDGYYHLFFAWSVVNADRGDIVNITALPLCRSTLTSPEQDYPAIEAAGAVMTGG